MRYSETVRFVGAFLLVSSGLAALSAVACSRPSREPGEVKPASPDGGVSVALADAAAPVAVTPISEPPPAPTCESNPNVFLFSSPVTPIAGAPLRVLAVSDKPLVGRLEVDGVASDTRRGGPPYFWLVETTARAASNATFRQQACADTPEGVAQSGAALAIKAGPANASLATGSGVWPARNAWSHSLENVYSAWIEALFDAPDNEQPHWAALHEVLRDPKRNLLFDHLGAKEDSAPTAPVIRPDCADLPYFLRAYFAWKLRLPFALAECNRGGGGAPPSCHGLITNEDPDNRARGEGVQAFGGFLRGTLADKAHSGSARTPFEDEAGDYYPVKLSWETLRPGTTYADPYGHVLVIAKRLPQTAERGGVLYAVDGQPDGTVARKRFWRGNFLYANARELGGPGFKEFRPVVRKNGALNRMNNASISASADYGDLSLDPGKLDTEGFYDAMDDVLSPKPMDAERAMLQTIDALEEQVRTRVQSVDNGRKWLDKHLGVATMPDGPEIFETQGAWEDFATPSRDLRLLIAIDVVKNFPARVARRPERFAKTATPVDLQAVLDRELKSRSVKYTRTDGSSFELTLAEVLARSTAFETTYNLNDCVETRWGAPPGSPEASTCRASAPADQRARMEQYRAWFHDRRRPPRK